MTRPTRDMSDRHEAYLAKLIGGRVTPGSGNHFANQADVRTDPRDDDAVAIDGKSTMARSITVKLDDWMKLVEQAHGNEPVLALRFYLNTRLTSALDLIVIRAEHYAELREAAGE